MNSKDTYFSDEQIKGISYSDNNLVLTPTDHFVLLLFIFLMTTEGHKEMWQRLNRFFTHVWSNATIISSFLGGTKLGNRLKAQSSLILHFFVENMLI